jgi:ferric-dicitrate binding protein FerR (iron transport regulator)
MAEHDDSDIARVLRATGGRANPSDKMKQAVYSAVHAEWRATLADRRRRRMRGVWLAVAASIAIAAVSLFFGRTLLDQQGEMVADVSRSVGVVQVREGDAGEWRNIPEASTLRVGQSIHTGADGRVALAMRDGVSVRLDHNTNVALVDADRIDVSAGAVYVDSGVTEPRAGRLIVETPGGVVRHVGTQYEARIVNGGTRIRVREGRVDVEAVSGSIRTLQVGDQIVVSRSGIEERGSIAPSSDEWDWASATAPEFDIDGRPVHEFLTWAGRETGLRVVFATPESAAEARRAVLSGSVAGLAPDEALAAVLPTTSLRSTKRDGQLVIELAGTPR